MGKKKLLLLGATGMAGHLIYFYLRNTGKYEIINVVFRNKLTDDSLILDITNKLATEQLIRDICPDIILNCIGILIKGSQLHPDNAIYINAYFPHLLERLATEINAKLVHISTDCVFSGKKGNYVETDFRDADDTYGRSKSLGEVINDKDITIRTSIIGPELKENGEGLFHWFMHQNGEINGYTKAFWGGITTLELAKVIEAIIEQKITGLINISNGKKISKYDLLKIFQLQFNRNGLLINSSEGKRVDKSLQTIRKEFKYKVPSYEAMIEDLHAYMNKNREIYSKFYSY